MRNLIIAGIAWIVIDWAICYWLLHLAASRSGAWGIFLQGSGYLFAVIAVASAWSLWRKVVLYKAVRQHFIQQAMEHIRSGDDHHNNIRP